MYLYVFESGGVDQEYTNLIKKFNWKFIFTNKISKNVWTNYKDIDHIISVMNV